MQTIIDHTLAWEKRSGVMFECNKTTIGAKILGMDLGTKPRFKGIWPRPPPSISRRPWTIVPEETEDTIPAYGHTALRGDRGADHGLHLRRLVAHARGERELTQLNRAQKAGARTIMGAFRTVATTVAEAEASIRYISKHEVIQHPNPAKDTSAHNTYGVGESKIHITVGTIGTHEG
ncbi:hypothetical protein CEP54_016367, partial [Fusarium duplospermum]